MTNCAIVGIGAYLPQKIITNNDLAQSVETTDEWIISRTGIKKRHIVEDELTSDLAAKAVLNALEYANLTPNDLDGIIVATATPDLIFPSTATSVQHKIGMQKGFAFDISAVCSGFIYALSVADSMIKAGNLKRIAVVGAEVLSKIVDWTDRSTCVLFGDGAGAVILEATKEKNRGIIGTEIHSDGSLVDILKVNGGVVKGSPEAKIEMNGREVFKNAVEKMSSSATNLLKSHQVDLSNIDWILTHQANYRIMQTVAQKLGIAEDKVIMTIDQHANTSAASIPLALDVYVKTGRVKKRDLILMTAVGAGLTWGSALLKL